MSAAVASSSARHPQMDDRTTESRDFLASTPDIAFASRPSSRMLNEAMGYADAMFIHRKQCRMLCHFIQIAFNRQASGEALEPTAPWEEVLAQVHSHLSNWSKLDVVHSYLRSEQIIREIDRLYEEIRSRCGMKSKTAAEALLGARRDDFNALAETLVSIIKDRQLLKQVASLSSDNIQCYLKALQKIIAGQSLPEDERKEYEAALLYLYKNADIILPVPNLANQITDLLEPVPSPSSVRNGVTRPGKTCQGTWLGTELVAVKSLKRMLSDHQARRRFQNDVTTWYTFRHPNILSIYGLFLDDARGCCLIYPWLSDGDVLTYLEKSPDVEVLHILHDVSCGLRFLHAYNPPVFHGDLRAANVLVKPDGRACLVGFGLAAVSGRLLTVPQSAEGASGTDDEEAEFALNRVRWLAPELMEQVDITSNEDIDVKGFSKASDVYSLGVTMFEILTSQLPFHDVPFTPAIQTIKSLIADICRAGARPRVAEEAELLAFRRGLNNNVWMLLEVCWHHNPAERPTAADVGKKLHSIIGKKVAQAGGRSANGAGTPTPHARVPSSAGSWRSVSSRDDQTMSSEGIHMGQGQQADQYPSRSPQRQSTRAQQMQNQPVVTRHYQPPLSARPSVSGGSSNTSASTHASQPPSSPPLRARATSPMPSHNAAMQNVFQMPHQSSTTSSESTDSFLSPFNVSERLNIPRVSTTSLAPKTAGAKDPFKVLVGKMTVAPEIGREWIGVANMEELRAYSPSQLRRQRSIERLVEEETRFLSSTVDVMFAKGLRGNPTIIGIAKLELFLTHVLEDSQTLRVVHRRFLDGLNSRPPISAGGMQHVAQVCIEAAAGFYSQYSEYASHLPDVMDRLSTEAESNYQFEEFMKAPIPGGIVTMRQALDTFLREPLTHLEHYPRIMQYILDETPNGHPDKPLFQMAWQEMTRTVYQTRLVSWQKENKKATWNDLVPAQFLTLQDKSEISRQEALFQIIAQEKEYNRKLRFIIYTLFQPVRVLTTEEEHDDDDDPFRGLMNVFEEILHLHTQLLENLFTIQRIQHPFIPSFVTISGMTHIRWKQLYEKRFVHWFVAVSAVVEGPKDNKAHSIALKHIHNRLATLRDVEETDLMTILRTPCLYLRQHVKSLRDIADLTPEDNEDCVTLSEFLPTLRVVSESVDQSTAASRESAQLERVASALDFSYFPGAEADVDFKSAERTVSIISKMFLKATREGRTEKDAREVFIILLDNYLIVTSYSEISGFVRMTVIDKPIPLESLDFIFLDPNETAVDSAGHHHCVVVQDKSRPQYAMALQTETKQLRDTWVNKFREVYSRRAHAAEEDKKIIQVQPIHRYIRTHVNSSSVTVHGVSTLLYTCDDPQAGIWVKSGNESPRLAVQMNGIIQMYTSIVMGLLLVLVEQNLLAFRLEDLVVPASRAPQAVKVDDSKSIKFFRVGSFEGTPMIIAYGMNKLRSVLRVFAKNKSSSSRLPFRNKDLFSVKGDIPFPSVCSDIVFLKARILVVSDTGFYLVDAFSSNLKDSKPPPSLPLANDPLAELAQRCRLAKPVAVQRVGDQFVLCYSNFGTYVNANGRLTGVVTEWQADTVQSVVFRAPWMFVIAPSVIEIRNMITGKLHQIIHEPGHMALSYDGREASDAGPDLDVHYTVRSSVEAGATTSSSSEQWYTLRGPWSYNLFRLLKGKAF